MKVLIEYDKNGKSKTSVKIDGRDLRESNVTLEKVIYPLLKKYRNLYNSKNPMRGYPAEFGPDPRKEEGPDNPDRFDEWLACLDKMVYAFEWIAKGKDWDGPEWGNCSKECDIALKLYKKECKTKSLELNKEIEVMAPVFDKYQIKFDEHRAKLQEGIDLFAKHFGSLWT
jgi:hypothetical protein